MEIHQHSHIPTSREKKWTHYFWEFLMLFLAVFCGFLAEYQLEHKIEKDREKEYVISLIRDLEKDTTELHTAIKGNSNRKNIYDSLLGLLKQPDPVQNENLLYYYFVATAAYNPFRAKEGTIRQLENAGGLRLIRNKKAVDAISAYYSEERAAAEQFTTYRKYFDQYHETAFTIFDYSQIDTLFFNRAKILNAGKRFMLITSDRTKLKILFNKLYALGVIIKSYRNYLNELVSLATLTITSLKREYDLR